MDSDFSEDTMVNPGPQTWPKLTTLTSRLKSLVSLASLKALYSHIGAVCQSLLHIHGLDVITLLYLRFRRGLNEEPPKVLLQSSFWLAMARCTIHIIPALVSIGLVILNYRGYFIGNELEGPMNQDDMKLGLLQVAAKVQVCLAAFRPNTINKSVANSDPKIIGASYCSECRICHLPHHSKRACVW